MNKLEICQRVLEEGDRDGELLTTTVLSSLVDNQHKDVVRWVEKAYAKLQRKNRYWGFLYTSGVMLRFTSGRNTASGPTVREPIYDSLRGLKVGTTAEFPIYYVPYQTFRRRYLLLQETPGPITQITRLPSGIFQCFPEANADYQVLGSWYMRPDTMDHDRAKPLWDEEDHEILVWMALQDYMKVYVVDGLEERVRMTLPEMMHQFAIRYLPDPIRQYG